MSFLDAWIYALRRELHNHKRLVVAGFVVVTLLVVIIGLVFPKRYQVSTVVFADDESIIKPLLSGSAEVTSPGVEQVAVARDRILSNRILMEALKEAKLAKSDVDEVALDPMIRGTRAAIDVTDVGAGRLKISFSSPDPHKAFDFATVLTNVFIRDTSRTKTKESRDAYDFIDGQVEAYKKQLQAAEDRLKNFKGGSGAITGDPSARIAQLRSDISALTLDSQVARARRDEIQRQLSQERQSSGRQFKTDGLRDRLAQAQSQIDTLRLSYNENYPDIVSLKQQILDLQKSIRDTESAGGGYDGSVISGPVYARLRGDLTDAEVNVRTLDLKLSAARQMLGEEQGFTKQGAEYEAQFADLTRDYTVTKQLYEDMLARKERARLSLVLDVEGQGVSYKIKEPPVFPRVPVGLRMLHFFIFAPLLGVIVPIALLAAYIQLDTRLRFVDRLQLALPLSIPVLAVVPHMDTPSDRRERRVEWLYLGGVAAIGMVIYLALGLLRLAGTL